MAFTQVNPGSMNPIVTQGAAQAFSSTAVTNASGSPQDLSAWVSLTAKIVPNVPSPTGSDTTFGTVTANSSGIITLETSTSDLASAMPGTARLVITGKPTSGDAAQLICNGTVVVQQG